MRRLSIALLFICSTVSINFGQAQSREDVLRELRSKRVELQQLEAQFLTPSPADMQEHAEFLSKPDTGLIRLLPREIYDPDVNKKNKSLTVRGGGSFYSFARLTHEYGYGSDIHLASGLLSVGFAGADYGIMVNLGNIPLDQLNSEDARVSFLAAYEPPQEEPKARTEARQIAGKGFTVGELEYRNRLAAVVDNTYVLRSIGYSDSDLLVAFRIIRKESDGSIVLAWKLLKKYPVPKLARAN